jgi:hypothetical protein
MGIEPAIFHCDNGMPKIGSDLTEWDVSPLFIEPEPRLRVGAVEDRVANSSRKAVDSEGVTSGPPSSYAAREEKYGGDYQTAPLEP